MRFLWVRLALAASLALPGAALGCSSSGVLEIPLPPDPPLGDATVRFDEPTTLTLAPGEAVTLDVIAAPPAAYSVRFALVGGIVDAWLESAEVEADPTTGRASVELHAPSQATTFSVRASLLDPGGVAGPSAERDVAVSDQGFGSVRITPLYLGHRQVTEWTASLVARTACKDLATMLPGDLPGALGGVAPPGGELVIPAAPVGPNLAIAVRAGHFAWGCADTTAMTPGQIVEVPVTVIDKPVDLSSADLGLTFAYVPDPGAYAQVLADAGELLGESFLPTGSKVGAVLLNGMQSLAPPTSPVSFGQQRIDKGWDSLAEQHFAALSPGLRQQVGAWIAAGLVLQSTSIEADCKASGVPGQPAFTVTRFGDLDPALAGVAPKSAFTWTAQPDDSLLLGGALVWEPSRFAGAAALAPALQAFPDASTVPGALAEAAACHDLAKAMGSFGACDLGCVEKLCGAALEARWDMALGASMKVGLPGKVTINASAAATVGDTAEPTAVSGHWYGKIGDGLAEASVSGAVSGVSGP
jgi:hypothetical protein